MVPVRVQYCCAECIFTTQSLKPVTLQRKVRAMTGPNVALVPRTLYPRAQQRWQVQPWRENVVRVYQMQLSLMVSWWGSVAAKTTVSSSTPINTVTCLLSSLRYIVSDLLCKSHIASRSGGNSPTATDESAYFITSSRFQDKASPIQVLRFPNGTYSSPKWAMGD